MIALGPVEYIEARVEVPNSLADAVCNYIIDNITSGMVLEEEDDSNRTGIIFYVQDSQAETFRGPLTDYLSQLVGDEMEQVPTIRERTIKDTDWLEKFRESVKPIMIGDDILVRPGWCQQANPVKYDIIIEPKMAFGTGSHETTQSCLRAVREHFQPGQRFLDLGTGSGIQSILADKIGASFIKAIDYDLTAIENCRENFRFNGVSSPHEILFGSISACEQDEPYDFVCTNIIKSTILPILPRLLSLTVTDGILVLAGLLEQDQDEIETSLRDLKQETYSKRLQGAWIIYVIHKS